MGAGSLPLDHRAVPGGGGSDPAEHAVDDGAWAFWTNGFRPEDTVDITIMYHWVIAGTLMDDSCRAIGCAEPGP